MNNTMLKRTAIVILALASPHSVMAFTPPPSTSKTPAPVEKMLLAHYTLDEAADMQLDDKPTTNGDFQSQGTRRQAIAAALISITSAASAAQAEVIGVGRCANGEGSGCVSLAEGNEYILSLQKKSLENKEENQREALYSYYMRNYPDVFAISDKRMVMKKDGSFALFSPSEVQQMVNDGNIVIEYPKAMGGRVADLTQKPVLVLKE